MKKIKLIFILIIITSVYAFGKDNNEVKFTIQMNPFFPLVSLFVSDGQTTLFLMDLEGQYRINNILNVSLTASFLYNEDNYWEDKYYQFHFKPMLIYRPFKTGLKGFYIGLYSIIGGRFYEDNYIKMSSSEIGFGISPGYKWIFRNGLTLHTGTGIGKSWIIPYKEPYSGYLTSASSDGRIHFRGLDISIIDFKIGYSF